MKKKILNFYNTKYLHIPRKIRFYIGIAVIFLGMAGIGLVGFWLMSLLHQFSQQPITQNNPTLDRSTLPSNGISGKVPLSSSTSVDPKRFAYQIVGRTTFTPSQRLQPVVNSILEYSKGKNLPLDALSITLIDTKTGERADYQGDIPRYPASVVKMFWLVTAYQKISQGELEELSVFPAIEQMIYKSDNQGASQILDAVTQTKSTSEKLSSENLAVGKQQRQKLNEFFRDAGYSRNINVSQKTFPIPQKNIMEPQGFDQQLRGENIEAPIRNKITTNDAARLMYEIINEQSIDSNTSKKMKKLLTRNIDPNFWKKQPPNPVDFNPVESFFGAGLPEGKTENIVSKAGWTSASRQEVAFIKSKDGKTNYILAVFGDRAAYGKSKKIFPEIANLVYKQMRLFPKI